MSKEQTRSRLIRVTEELILAEGYEAVTVRRIAEAAGCTFPLLYHYFKDMDALFWQLRMVMIDEMIAELTPVPDKIDEPVQGLKQIFTSYAGYFLNHPNTFRFFYYYPFNRPEGGDELMDVEQRFQLMRRQSFLALVQGGLIRENEVEITAKTIIYAIQGMILLFLSANGNLTENGVYQEINEMIDLLVGKEPPLE